MLGVISSKVSLSMVTRALRVLEETLGRREDEVYLLESITICLTAFLPLLEEVCVNIIVNTHVVHTKPTVNLITFLMSGLAMSLRQRSKIVNVFRLLSDSC